MTTQQRNLKARQHGDAGEAAALQWLRALIPGDDIRVINTLLDLLVLNTFVEVKTCSEQIVGNTTQKFRAGRFTLDSAQHEVLVDCDGYYLFVVLRFARSPKIWIADVKDISFHRQLSWPTALKYRRTFSDTRLRREK